MKSGVFFIVAIFKLGYHGYANCKNKFIAVALATPVFDSGLCDI